MNLRFIFTALLFFCLSAASPPPKLRAKETLSQSVYEAITGAQELSTQGKNQQALSNLDNLLKGENLSGYERALVLQQQAYVWVEQENFSKASSLLQQALALQALPKQLELNALFNLAQIYVAGANYQKAIAVINQWLGQAKKTLGKVPAQGYALLAQAWALSGDVKKATPYAEAAVRARQTPRREWLHLLASLYLQQNFYRKALTIAEQGVKLYPKDKIFWSQLVGLYAELKQEKKSFAALRTMFALGLFTKPAQWTHLAQSYLAYDAPVQAALILEQGLAQGVLEKNEKNYTLLGDAWALAREWQKAIVPLRKAAPLAEHGKIWQRLGRAYTNGEQWQQAEQAFVKALKKGKLNDEARAWLLLGIARAKQNKKDEAFAALGKAIAFDSISSEAKVWLDNLRSAQ